MHDSYKYNVFPHRWLLEHEEQLGDGNKVRERERERELGTCMRIRQCRDDMAEQVCVKLGLLVHSPSI